MHDRTYSDDEITPWFSMNTPPIRQGLYQLRLHNSRDIVDGWYADGRWQIGVNGFFSPLSLSRSQFEWRGLSVEPRTIMRDTP